MQTTATTMTDIPNRILVLIDKADGVDGCWIWKGQQKQTAHGPVPGGVWIDGTTVGVIRYIYEKTKGPLPRRVVLKLKCGNQQCCNPYHRYTINDPTSRTRVCCRCLRTKPLEEFHHSSKDKSGFGVRGQCKDCRCSTNIRAGKTTRNAHQYPDSKTCTLCHETKPIDDFAIQPEGKYGRYSYCKSCCNTTLYPKKRDLGLRAKYGITLEDYESMLAEQGGVCAVCKAVPTIRGRNPFHVDHDHVTGKVRAILCYACNSALGLIRESKEIALSLASYIDEYN